MRFGLDDTLIAATLGLASGFVLLAVLGVSVRFRDPKDPLRGVIAGFAMLGASLVAGVGLLFGYQVAAPRGFAAFGLALVVGFMLATGLATAYAVKALERRD